jgi:hypothetical protein
MTQSAYLDLDLSDLELCLVAGGTGKASARCALPEMSAVGSAPAAVASSPALAAPAPSASGIFGLPEFLAAVAHEALPNAGDLGHAQELLTSLLSLPEAGGGCSGLPADVSHADASHAGASTADASPTGACSADASHADLSLPDAPAADASHAAADTSTGHCGTDSVVAKGGALDLPECAGDSGGHHADLPATSESHSCASSHHGGDDGAHGASSDASSTSLPEATSWYDGSGGN